MTSASLTPFLLGAIVGVSLVAALFFARFYRDTGDQLFLFFAGAFVLESGSRTLLAFWSAAPNEGYPAIYVLRAVAYSLIVIGIYRKNR